MDKDYSPLKSKLQEIAESDIGDTSRADSAVYLPTEEQENKRGVPIGIEKDQVIQNKKNLFIDKFLLTDERVLLLAQELEKPGCKIQNLEILTNTFGSKNLKVFCETLKRNRSLRELVLNQV